jgi:hypothetical protein
VLTTTWKGVLRLGLHRRSAYSQETRKTILTMSKVSKVIPRTTAFGVAFFTRAVARACQTSVT